MAGVGGTLSWLPYGDSVDEGTQELLAYLTDRTVTCPNEAYVLAGHSQGAQVITDGATLLPVEIRNRIAHVAVFGDPTWDNGPYPFPALTIGTACVDGPRQWVRGSAPCTAGPGIVGLTKDPYVADDMEQRVGAWCRKADGICGGSIIDIFFNGDVHGAYFEEASESALAAREAAEALSLFLPEQSANFDVSWDEFVFGATGADLAIVFDTTGSMGPWIADAKSQATDLAETWLDFFQNGRVALVEYKDEGDPFVARIDAPLSNDVVAFQDAVDALTASGGGDWPEAQLSGIMQALNGLDWADGATKVTMVITDAPGKDPEPTTGYTRDQVSQRALEIDPVAIYGVAVATAPEVSDFLEPMADATAGQVFTLQSEQTLSDALFEVLDAAHAAPVAKLRSPYFGKTGEPLVFDASGSFDASATITSYEWDFDLDGSVDQTTSSPQTSYTYTADYDGLISVRVVAADGQSALATAEVTVDALGLEDDLPLPPTELSAAVSGPTEVTVEWTPASNDRADGYFVTLEDGTVVGLRLATDPHSVVVPDIDVSQPVTFVVSAGNQFGRSTGVAATTSAGGVPVTTRVSESDGHGQGNGNSNDSYISGDGRLVTFVSDATDLVSGDTNGYADVFVHDRLTATTTRVSVSAGGAQANQRSQDPAISADGAYVIFPSYASNLISGDTNAKRDIFVVELATGTVERVSVGLNGAQPDHSSSDPVISGDGRYLAYRTDAANLVAGDTNGIDDIFWYDRVTGTTLRVSVASDGSQANAESTQPAISGDGRYVVFSSDADNLVPGDTNGVRDIFVHDTQTGTTSRLSVAAGGAQANAGSDDPAISGDGALVAFESDASNLIAGDVNAKKDVFVVSLATGAVERVSVDSSGVAGNHTSREPSLSADGRYVAFDSSASNLVTGDTNGKLDVFVHDRVTGQTTLFSVALDSELPGNHQSLNPCISGDGATVAFESDASDLVADDTNAARDVFVRGPAP